MYSSHIKTLPKTLPEEAQIFIYDFDILYHGQVPHKIKRCWEEILQPFYKKFPAKKLIWIIPEIAYHIFQDRDKKFINNIQQKYNDVIFYSAPESRENKDLLTRWSQCDFYEVQDLKPKVLKKSVDQILEILKICCNAGKSPIVLTENEDTLNLYQNSNRNITLFNRFTCFKIFLEIADINYLYASNPRYFATALGMNLDNKLAFDFLINHPDLNVYVKNHNGKTVIDLLKDDRSQKAKDFLEKLEAAVSKQRLRLLSKEFSSTCDASFSFVDMISTQGKGKSLGIG